MTILKMPSNQVLIVSALCLLFAITGGVGGYTLKSRMQETGKPELTTGLPDLNSDKYLGRSNNKLLAKCEPQASENTSTTLATSSPSDINVNSRNRIKRLLKTIYLIASQQEIEFNLDTQVKTEIEFLNIIDDSPELIDPLLSVYQQMRDSETKEFLRSLLTMTSSREIQQRAIDYLSSGQLENQHEWLLLLRDTGVHSASSRQALFNIIPTLNEPQAIHDAILAITPQIVSADERQSVINQLSNYMNHNSELVRIAAIESLSKWADNSHAHVLEQALSDASDSVRHAAISAAYGSGVRSDYIESILLGVMTNSSEDLQMRIHAYNALSNYTLQGQNYDQYYHFHQQVIAIENSGEAKG